MLSSPMRRKIFARCLLAISLFLISSATILSVNGVGGNTTTGQNSDGTHVCAQPASVSTPVVLSGSIEVQVSIFTEINITHVVITHIGKDTQTILVNANFSDRKYFYAYITLNGPQENNNISIDVQNQTDIFLNIRIQPSYLGLYAEVFLLTGIVTFIGFFLTVEIKSKKYLLLVPVYIALSIVYGQRYDDFFLISLGMRIYDRANPYALSGFTPAGLQWEYPPLFAIWSYFSTVFYHYILGFSIPSNTQLNYVEVSYGNIYSAWRSLAASNLFVLYGLLKLPFVLSFFWISHIIYKMKGQVSWKLWLINPLAVVVGILWGQLDVLGLAFLLQAVYYHKQQKGFQAVLFASIGAAIKVFPVFVIPLMIARSGRKLLSATAILPVVAVSIAVYAASGNIFGDITTIVMGRSVPTFLGVFSSQGLTWQIIVSYLSVKSFPSLFLYIFAPGYVLFTAYALLKKIDLETYFILTMLFFFVTYNFMNPQYLIWLLPFLIMRDETRYAAIISVIGSLYLYLNYSYTYFLNPDIAWNYTAGFLGQIEEFRHNLTSNAGTIISLGILSSIFFALMFIRIWRETMNTKQSSRIEMN